MRSDRHVARRTARAFLAVALLALAAVGALAIVEAGVPPAVLAVAAAGLLVAVVTTMTTPGRRPGTPIVARRVGLGVALLLALVGAVEVSGGTGLVLVAAGALAWSALAPGGRGTARRVLGLVSKGEHVWARLERQARAGVGTAYLRLELRALADPVLLDVWSAGRRPVLQRLPASVLLGVATLRELVLDELEARDPVGFHAWLDAGALAPAPPVRRGHP
jgi:hypothetical protein